MKKTFVIHPFLFAIFPVLFLFAKNVNNYPLEVIVLPIAVTVSFALLVWLLLSLAVKNKQKAAMVVSLSILLFFSYGHFHSAIGNLNLDIGGLPLSSNKILFPVWGIFFFLGAYFSIRTRKNLYNFTKLLNGTAALLVGISVVNIGLYKLKTGIAPQNNERTEDIKAQPTDSRKPAYLPNMYYIILDGYARADILREIYHYDNGEFLDDLSQKGFYVADKSRSNYPQTGLSVASSLNLKYLDDLAERLGSQSNNRAPLRNMIRNSEVRHFLKQHGYTFVAFSTGYSPTEITNADVYIKTGYFNVFINGLINTTPLPVVLSRLPLQYDIHRKGILYVLEYLVETAERKDPIFVFAHIVAPHPPFVFGEQGEKKNPGRQFAFADGSDFMKQKGATRNEYLGNYTSQLIFINKKVKAVVDGILSKSDKPPIIILQGDHGPGAMLNWEAPDNSYLKERMSILNAYYLPDDGHIDLYDKITPVNTFRVIFNHYFGTSYSLLKDRSYFATWDHPYSFIDVTDNIGSEPNTKPAKESVK